MSVGAYSSPLGEIILAADEEGLVGLWFVGQKYERRGLEEGLSGGEGHISAAKAWLDSYFQGQAPALGPELPLRPRGTDFQKKVWARLSRIPYGRTMSYSEIARDLGGSSARAVGSAVGKNPLSIFIPCHRVLGKNGSLTGYAGGLERKRFLLELEKGT